MNRKNILAIIFFIILNVEIIFMNYNLQMKIRNSEHSTEDNYYPIIKAENVLTTHGTIASELEDIYDIKENTVYLSRTLESMFRGQTVKIICYGDSITWGRLEDGSQSKDAYPNVLQSMLRSIYNNEDITVMNYGVSGRQTDTALEQFDTEVVSQSPDLVIIMFGINDSRDMEGGTLDVVSTTEYKENLSEIIKKCRYNSIEVLLLSPTPTIEENENKELILYNIACKEVANSNNVAFIDMHQEINKLFFEEGEEVPVKFFPDSIHFVDGKYKYIAESIMQKSLSYRNAYLNIDREITIPIAYSPFIDTDITNYFSEAAQKVYTSIYFSKLQNGGTYLKFNFYVDILGLDLALIHAKSYNGGIMPVYIDGKLCANINYYNLNEEYDVKTTLAENLSIGWHSLEVRSSDIMQGSATENALANFSEFKFIKHENNLP